MHAIIEKYKKDFNIDKDIIVGFSTIIEDSNISREYLKDMLLYMIDEDNYDDYCFSIPVIISSKLFNKVDLESFYNMGNNNYVRAGILLNENCTLNLTKDIFNNNISNLRVHNLPNGANLIFYGLIKNNNVTNNMLLNLTKHNYLYIEKLIIKFHSFNAEVIDSILSKYKGFEGGEMFDALSNIHNRILDKNKVEIDENSKIIDNYLSDFDNI